MSSSLWNKEEIATLVKLWKQNLSASEIGIKMKKSRNAVIGKINRVRKNDGTILKRSISSSAPKVKKKPAYVRSNKQARIPKKDEPKPLFPKREVPIVENAALNPVPFAELGRNRCKFVINEGHPSEFVMTRQKSAKHFAETIT